MNCLAFVYSDINLNILTASLSSKFHVYHVHKSISVAKNICPCEHKSANIFACCFYLNNEILSCGFFPEICGGNKYFEKYPSRKCKIKMYFNVSKKVVGLKLSVYPLKMESVSGFLFSIHSKSIETDFIIIEKEGESIIMSVRNFYLCGS